MQKRRNIRLLIVFSTLMVSCLALLFFGVEDEKSSKNSRFRINDSEAVTAINFQGTIQTRLELKNGVWMLNNTYKADAQLVELFLNILKRIKARRSVPKNDTQQVLELFNESGTRLSIMTSEEVREFEVTVSEEGQTYYKEDQGIPYEMNIPGYSSQLGSLFFLTENQWRNKVLFSSNFRTIKKLSFRNFNKPERSMEVIDNGEFLEVSGVESLDTIALMVYIENLNYFDADGFIDRGEYPRFDSLEENTEPFVQLTISDIDTTFSNSILIYPRINKDRYFFGITREGQRFVLEGKKAESLIPGEEFFTAKP